MSVLIKGMEMPTSCAECRFCGEYCYAKGDENKYSKLPCPLVPVPDHGRLIDADALPTYDKPIGKMMMFGGEYVYTQTAIDNAPTIIPAEEGGE